MIEFKDHFSEAADAYARYRPVYPTRLYEHLAALSGRRDRCWDCATGNGQAALSLAEHFTQVVATDASAKQLARAPSHERVEFRLATAEASKLEDASVDFIAVATALHWFDLPAFYAEVRRVGRSESVLAAWSYGARVEVGPRVDEVVMRLVHDVLDDYWPPDFHHVRTRYRDLPFPFETIDLGQHHAVARHTLPQFMGNIGTWSGVQAYAMQRGEDAIDLIREELTQAWLADVGAVDRAWPTRWPLHGLVGRVHPRSGDLA